MTRKLDLEHWERQEIFQFMSALSQPFYTVCFNLDVTNVYEYTHKKKLSFYYALIYLATQAINEVPAFLQDIVDGEVVVWDRRSPSFRDIRPGSGAFYIDVTCITNERDFHRDDTVPRISWGRYTDWDGRKTLNLSLEVNHRTIDGFHVGQFERRLREKIALLG